VYRKRTILKAIAQERCACGTPCTFFAQRSMAALRLTMPPVFNGLRQRRKASATEAYPRLQERP